MIHSVPYTFSSRTAELQVSVEDRWTLAFPPDKTLANSADKIIGQISDLTVSSNDEPRKKLLSNASGHSTLVEARRSAKRKATASPNQ